jgi:hypothetical protein
LSAVSHTMLAVVEADVEGF